MKFSTFALFLLGLALGGSGVYYWQQQNHEPTPTQPKEPVPKAPRAASALGRIQPANGLLSLGVPLPDRLGKLLVHEGSEVKEGAVLAELESRTDRALELKLLDQQIQEAQDKIQEIRENGKLQIALEELQIEQMEALGPVDLAMQRQKAKFLEQQAAQAENGLERIANLPSVSLQEREQQAMLVSQYKAEHEGALGLVKKMELMQKLNLKLAKAKIKLAEANLERTVKEVPLNSLKEQRALTERRYEQAQLKAPSKGKVLRVFAHPGELVGAPQPILQMADLSQMAVLAEVYETDIHKIFEGQQAQIASKAMPGNKLTGKVVAIGGIIGKNRVFDADPLADVDRRVLEVKVMLDQPALAAGFINHQVTVEFQPR